jgi:hypothetical protein
MPRMVAPTLSDEQLGELLTLIEGADSVELKLTVPESDHHAAVGVLGLDPLDAQIRQVYFFDTPDLSLSKGGIVVRARRVQGKGDDSVVKLRPVVPDQLPKKLRKTRGFGVEVDAMPGGFVCSGSMKSPAQADVRETVTGEVRCASSSRRSSTRFSRSTPATGSNSTTFRFSGRSSSSN